MTVRQIGLVILVALVAQTTIAWSMGTARANLDLPLVAVVFAALAGGPMTGFLSGAVAGCAQDWLSGGIVGVNGLSKSLVGLGVGGVTAHLMLTGLAFQGLAIAVATIVHVWGFVAIYTLMPQAGPSGAWDVILMQVLANVSGGVLAVSAVQYGLRMWGTEPFPRARRRRIG